MTQERIRERLKQLHEYENELNKSMGKITAQMSLLNKQKLKLQKKVSSNMKYRNDLIKQL